MKRSAGIFLAIVGTLLSLAVYFVGAVAMQIAQKTPNNALSYL